MKVRRWRRYALGAAAALAVGAASSAQTLVEVNNVRDITTTGSLTLGDQYLFTTSPVYTDANGFKFGPAIPLADPTIMWGPDGNYYITGTDDLGNFRIYKTSDFKTFSLHKPAFSDSTRIYADRPDGTRCKINRIGNGGMLYTNLQAPQLLYKDGVVYLVFTAVGAALKANPSNPVAYSDVITVPHWANSSIQINPLFPWHSGYQSWFTTEAGSCWSSLNMTTGDGNWAFSDVKFGTISGPCAASAANVEKVHDACLNETFDFISAFVTSVSWTDFVKPAASGGNFSIVSPFSYLNGGVNMYDGGASIGKILPTTAFTTHTVNVPPLIKWSSPANVYTNASGATFPPKGFRHIKTDGTDWHAHARSLGGSIFLDPKDSNQPWYIYDWYNLGADAPGPAGSPYYYYGHHIAGVRLTSLSTYWLISTVETNSPYHWGRNTNVSPALTPSVQAEWGTYDGSGNPSPSDSSAIEGGTAFYDSDRDAYVSLGSRNMWDSPAYSIHYRYGINKANFRQMALTAWDSNAIEFTLLKSQNPVSPVTDPITWNTGRSYGLGQIIHLQKANGDPVLENNKRVAMLVFHAKMDGSNDRTVFFKKLTFLNPPTASDPLFKTLIDLNSTSTDLDTDPWRTQFPTSW